MTTKAEASLSAIDERAEDEIVDETLVEAAVKHIKTTLEETAFKGAVVVGDYIFKEFFGGDVDRVRSRNPNKNASFRKLAEKCGTQELPVSKSFLSNAVGVAVMCKALPGQGSYKQLPPSHQTALLPLHEPTKIEEVAEQAVKEDWSVRELRAVVQKKVAKHKGGRSHPPKPLVIETLERSLRLFIRGPTSFTKAQANELNAEEAKHARQIAEELMASLKKLMKQLKKK